MTDAKRLPPVAKLALELGPLALFFLANAYADRFGFAESRRIFAATGLFIAAWRTVAMAVVKMIWNSEVPATRAVGMPSR